MYYDSSRINPSHLKKVTNLECPFKQSSYLMISWSNNNLFFFKWNWIISLCPYQLEIQQLRHKQKWTNRSIFIRGLDQRLDNKLVVKIKQSWISNLIINEKITQVMEIIKEKKFNLKKKNQQKIWYDTQEIKLLLPKQSTLKHSVIWLMIATPYWFYFEWNVQFLVIRQQDWSTFYNIVTTIIVIYLVTRKKNIVQI